MDPDLQKKTKVQFKTFKEVFSKPNNSSVTKILNPKRRFGDRKFENGEKLEVSMLGKLKRAFLCGLDESINSQQYRFCFDS